MKASFLSTCDKVRIPSPALKKTKIQVFATITLFFQNNAFPHHPKNSGDDENINSCIELLYQVLVFTHP